METKNAIIKSASITNDDHGVLTAWLMLDYGGTGQGFGGYALYLPKPFIHHEPNNGIAGHFLWRVLEVADVARWEDLPGRTIRVRADFEKVHAIGHILKNDWFSPENDFASSASLP